MVLVIRPPITAWAMGARCSLPAPELPPTVPPSRATASAAQLATSYLHAVQALAGRWRERLSALPRPPRSDAAAWAIIDLLPAHPLITAAVAAAVTGRSKPATYQALEELESAGVLVPLSQSQRNRVWEADGLLDLLAGLEAGRVPPRS